MCLPKKTAGGGIVYFVDHYNPREERLRMSGVEYGGLVDFAAAGLRIRGRGSSLRDNPPSVVIGCRSIGN
jgi:hypothetical protein